MRIKNTVFLLPVWLAVTGSTSAAPTESSQRSPEAVRVINKGTGGNNSADGLRRFQRDVIDLHPDHLILYFGINDALNSHKLVPPAAFRANMQKMIDLARSAGIRTVILTTPNPILANYVKARHPKHPAKDLDHHLLEYDAVIRRLAKQNGLPLADLRKRVEAHGGANETKSCLVRNRANSNSSDGVHLTPGGYRLMAELYEPILSGKVRPGHVVVCFGDSITYGAHVKGAGTASGETYPARLSRILNRRP